MPLRSAYIDEAGQDQPDAPYGPNLGLTGDQTCLDERPAPSAR